MFGPTSMMMALLLVGLIWLTPIILVASSNRGTGLERAIWALVCVWLSWLGYVGFHLSTRKTN